VPRNFITVSMQSGRPRAGPVLFGWFLHFNAPFAKEFCGISLIASGKICYQFEVYLTFPAARLHKAHYDSSAPRGLCPHPGVIY
jgi:hypothetical protein